MYAVVSITPLGLWENNIPDIIFTYLFSHTSFQTKEQLSYMPRHHSKLIHIFTYHYGQYLDFCPFARLYTFPDRYSLFYTVKQAPCYRSCKYPERVVLFKRHYLTQEKLHLESKNTLSPSQINGQIAILRNLIKYEQPKIV
jgi:hypothetical protein